MGEHRTLPTQEAYKERDMTTNDRRTRLAEDRLRAAGVTFDRLEDVPVKVVRAANLFGFPAMRFDSSPLEADSGVAAETPAPRPAGDANRLPRRTATGTISRGQKEASTTF